MSTIADISGLGNSIRKDTKELSESMGDLWLINWYSQRQMEGKPEGILEYRVRWYGFDPADDTWEPVENIPRHFIVQFHRGKKTKLPMNLSNAQVG